MNGALPGVWTVVEGLCFEYPLSTDDVRGGWGQVMRLGLSDEHFMHSIHSQHTFNQGWVVESH